jgi:hypothetical protein
MAAMCDMDRELSAQKSRCPQFLNGKESTGSLDIMTESAYLGASLYKIWINKYNRFRICIRRWPINHESINLE